MSGRAARAPRVLVMCAEVGEGHVTVARRLVADLEARPDVGAVALRTDLEVMGPRLGRFLTRGFRTHLAEGRWTYEVAFRVFDEWGQPRRAAQELLGTLARPGLTRTIGGFRADVVVTEYPVLSAALGVLRRRGQLGIPVCSSISDPTGLEYWAHPGIDLHLCSWPEAVREVEGIAGPGRAAAVRPLVDARFPAAPDRATARRRLELPSAAPVVLVSGGGWGIGDLAGAARTALDGDPETVVVCLAGRAEAVRDSLRRAVGGHPRARVLGFTDEMPALLAAADALVHTTGGTTALEARVVGCPLVNYGRGIAHVRGHARALAELGVAEWAPERDDLPRALACTLARGRPPPLDAARLADAAELVAAIGRRRVETA